MEYAFYAKPNLIKTIDTPPDFDIVYTVYNIQRNHYST